jgi:hypothetical protein
MTKQNVSLFAGILVAGLSGVGIWAGAGDDPAHVKQLIETKVCVQCNLQDAKLKVLDAEKGNVANSDFRGADLYKANFKGADLTGAQFGGANLNGADLSGAKGADLTGATTNEYTVCPSGMAGPCQQ